jgi:hypothetical protein
MFWLPFCRAFRTVIRPVMEQASTNLLCERKYKTKKPIQNASA